MARVTNAELMVLVERLQAENDELRVANDELRVAAVSVSVSASAGDGGVDPLKRPRRAWGRTVASVALVLLGLLLAPVAVGAHWVGGQLSSTDTFVATFAPLAEDEAVKALVVTEVMAAVDRQVDFRTTTGQAFDAIAGLGLPPTASAALQALEEPAALGLRSLATSVVTDVVDSDAFGGLWREALRVSHEQVAAALLGEPGSALTISSSGELAVQLAPVLDAVKAAMVEQGLGFAAAIPSVDVSVVVAQSDGLARAALVFGLVVAVGAWLPWVALVLLAAGVLIAHRRLVVLFRAALALGAAMVLLGIAVRIGQVVLVATIAPGYEAVDAVAAIYEAAISPLVAGTVTVGVLAFSAAVIAWLLGPSRPATSVRGVVRRTARRLRAPADTPTTPESTVRMEFRG
ncbi:hypothetical protein ACEXQD_18065 [Herbiconiux sp. P15]|uniref:hypothetical protein n=1 Tax=Herbiconiux liukaitaii TaxID=3342799 RepID=UPI0035B83C85